MLQIGVAIEEPFSILPLEDITSAVQSDTAALLLRQDAVADLLRRGGVECHPRSGGASCSCNSSGRSGVDSSSGGSSSSSDCGGSVGIGSSGHGSSSASGVLLPVHGMNGARVAAGNGSVDGTASSGGEQLNGAGVEAGGQGARERPWMYGIGDDFAVDSIDRD